MSGLKLCFVNVCKEMKRRKIEIETMISDGLLNLPVASVSNANWQTCLFEVNLCFFVFASKTSQKCRVFEILDDFRY